MARRGPERAADGFPTARPGDALVALADVGEHVVIEDGTTVPTSALVLAYPDSPHLDDDTLASRLIADNLTELVDRLARHLDALEQRTARPVLAAVRYRGSAVGWKAVIAEHGLTVDDPRLIELDD